MSNQQSQAQQPNTNMTLYTQLREVPSEAKKPIQDGRLAGKTDVNPMWRIKRLTEIFGACGFGWRYEITRKWIEDGGTGSSSAFVDVNLYVKDPSTGQWSEPIPGTGGNVFKRTERSGNIYLNDDCYKMALTDALSVAAKALGLAADVWFESDTTKYINPNNTGVPAGYAQPPAQQAWGFGPAPQGQYNGPQQQGYAGPPQQQGGWQWSGAPQGGPQPQAAPQQQPPHNAPPQQEANTGVKIRLTPSNTTAWNRVITQLARTTDPPEKFRREVLSKYDITPEDLFQLAQSANKPEYAN